MRFVGGLLILLLCVSVLRFLLCLWLVSCGFALVVDSVGGLLLVCL